LSVPTSTRNRRVTSKHKAARSRTAKSKAVKSKAAKNRAAKNKAAQTSTAPVPRPSTTVQQPSPEEEAAFTETLIESGLAARLDEEGKLPAGATHKIVEDEAGNVKIVRRRFSMT
jgi:hypothetical protein